MPESPQVFVSFHNRDERVARAVAEQIRAGGFRTWLYVENNTPGRRYIEEISEALGAADVVVAILSRDSLASRQCENEMVQALELRKPCIPLLVGITHEELTREYPHWRQLLGSAVSMELPPANVAAVADRLLAGVSAAIGRPQAPRSSQPHVHRPAPAAGAFAPVQWAVAALLVLLVGSAGYVVWGWLPKDDRKQKVQQNDNGGGAHRNGEDANGHGEIPNKNSAVINHGNGTPPGQVTPPDPAPAATEYWRAVQEGNATWLRDNLPKVKAADLRQENGETLLHRAAFHGHASLPPLLLEAGVPKDALYGPRTLTALHVACERGQVDFALALLKAGPDVKRTTSTKDTPLHLVADRADAVALVEPLVSAGCSLTATNGDGETPLHIAARGHVTPMVRALLARGAEVNARANRGLTPLHLAVNGIHSKTDPSAARETVAALLAAGADAAAQDHEGKTPLQLAEARSAAESDRALGEVIQQLNQHRPSP